jgi:uncharacterized protein YjlB
MLYFDSAAAVQYARFGDNETTIANSPLPVVFYRGLAGFVDPLREEMRTCNSIKTLIGYNGWGLEWIEKGAVFQHIHFHSNRHEILLVLHGSAQLALGGGSDPALFCVAQGDAVAIPAGVAHCRVSNKDPNFVVAGLYPPGPKLNFLEPSVCSRNKVLRDAAKVRMPDTDPFWGYHGPLKTYWY